MITIILVSLIAGALYILWKNERQNGTYDSPSPKKNLSLWLLIGLLTIAALFTPKVREKIQELRQKIKSD